MDGTDCQEWLLEIYQKGGLANAHPTMLPRTLLSSHTQGVCTYMVVVQHCVCDVRVPAGQLHDHRMQTSRGHAMGAATVKPDVMIQEKRRAK